MTGGELRRLRRSVGLTQKALAQHLRMAPGYVAQLERGEAAVREVVRLAVLQIVGSLPKPKGRTPRP
jgi:transcriptional regulator with XRE-family HTH domain